MTQELDVSAVLVGLRLTDEETQVHGTSMHVDTEEES